MGRKRRDPRPPGNKGAKYPIKKPDDWYRFAQTPRRTPLPAPNTGIFDEPSVCLPPINAKWFSHISGMIDVLSEFDAWDGDENAQYDATRQIIDLLGSIVREACVMNCEDVENCLETSQTISNLQAATDANTASNQQQQDQLDDMQDNPPDGNVYPADFPLEGTTASCGGAYYVVQELEAFIVEIEGLPSSYSSPLDALRAILDLDVTLVFATVSSLIVGLFAPTPPPSVLPSFQVNEAAMVEYLYCNGFDKLAFSDYVRSLDPAIADYVDSLAFSTWEKWVNVGAIDDTQDCSAFICNTWTLCFVNSEDGLNGAEAYIGTFSGDEIVSQNYTAFNEGSWARIRFASDAAIVRVTYHIRGNTSSQTGTAVRSISGGSNQVYEDVNGSFDRDVDTGIINWVTSDVEVYLDVKIGGIGRLSDICITGTGTPPTII